MKVLILYRPNSEHARKIEQYCRDFVGRDKGRKVDLVNIDTIEGSHLAELYAVTRYPAVVASANDGTMLHLWQGDTEVPPLMSELAYYASQ